MNRDTHRVTISASATSARRRRVVRALVAIALLAVPVSLVAAGPGLAGSGWAAVAGAVRDVRVWWLAPIALVWWLGLYAHSAVLTSALPGLSVRRALSLNLAGSAVANTVPMGGPVSVGLTSAMATSWGFSPPALGAFLAVSTAWNVLARLVGGALGIGLLLVARPGAVSAASLGWLVGAAVVGLVALGVVLASERSCARLGAVLGAGADRVSRLRRRDAHDRPGGYARAAMRVRRHIVHILRRSWPAMSLGSVAYFALLCLLLDLCLRALGSPAPLGLVLAAVGVERLVTAVPVTPGGAGVAELGLIACLSVGAVTQPDAVAAALLYRFFTFFLEIPVGTVVALTWGWHRRRASSLPAGLTTSSAAV